VVEDVGKARAEECFLDVLVVGELGQRGLVPARRPTVRAQTERQTKNCGRGVRAWACVHDFLLLVLPIAARWDVLVLAHLFGTQRVCRLSNQLLQRHPGELLRLEVVLLRRERRGIRHTTRHSERREREREMREHTAVGHSLPFRVTGWGEKVEKQP
jgi:hypothetical protein